MTLENISDNLYSDVPRGKISGGKKITLKGEMT